MNSYKRLALVSSTLASLLIGSCDSMESFAQDKPHIVQPTTQKISPIQKTRTVEEATKAIQKEIRSYDVWIQDAIASRSKMSDHSAIELVSPRDLEELFAFGLVSGLFDVKGNDVIWLPLSSDRTHVVFNWAHSLPSQAAYLYLDGNQEKLLGSRQNPRLKAPSDDQIESFLKRKGDELVGENYWEIFSRAEADHDYYRTVALNRDLSLSIHEIEPIIPEMERTMKEFEKDVLRVRGPIGTVSFLIDNGFWGSELERLVKKRDALDGKLEEYKKNLDANNKARFRLKGAFDENEAESTKEAVASCYVLLRSLSENRDKQLAGVVSNETIADTFKDLDTKVGAATKKIERLIETECKIDIMNLKSTIRTHSNTGSLARAVGSLYEIHLGHPTLWSFQLNKRDLEFLRSFQLDGKPMFEKGLSRYQVALEMLQDGVAIGNIRERLMYAETCDYNGKTYSWPPNNFYFTEPLATLRENK